MTARPRRDNLEGEASWKELLLAFVLLAIGYAFLDFLLIPSNRLVLHPLHHDDYTNLARSFATIGLGPPRPVSTLAIALLSTAGPRTYYLTLNLLTILYPALVFYFLARLFRRVAGPFPIAVAAALLLALPHSVEWAKYTGLITSLLSGVFGTLALILIAQALRGEAETAAAWGGVAFYALSIFSKEDFALPGLLLVLFCLTERGARRPRAWAILGAVLLCILALFVYNAHYQSPFTSLAAAGPYQVQLRPSSVASVLRRYFTFTPLVTGVLVLLGVSATFAALTCRECRRPLLLTVGIIGSLIAPYSLLPNHFAGYYAYGWLAWEAGLICVCIVLLAERFPRAIVYASFALIALLALWRTQAERKAIVEWYARESILNEQIVKTLIQNRAAISRAAEVGVVGIEGLSPWSHSAGDYLRNRLGFRNRWIVFVPKSDMFYSLDGPPASPDSVVQVRPLWELPRWPNLPVLFFDQAGSARLNHYASGAEAESLQGRDGHR